MSVDPYQPPESNPQEIGEPTIRPDLAAVFGSFHLIAAFFGFFVGIHHPSLDSITTRLVQITSLTLSGVLVVAGVGLLRRHSWAQAVTNGYAATSLLVKATMITITLIEPNSATVQRDVIIFSLAAAVYPLLCLLLLNRTSVKISLNSS